jgi:hypothetical protein
VEVATGVIVRQNVGKWGRGQKTAEHRHQLSRAAHPKFDSRACVNCDIDETCVKNNITVIKWDKNSTKQKENKEEDVNKKMQNMKAMIMMIIMMMMTTITMMTDVMVMVAAAVVGGGGGGGGNGGDHDDDGDDDDDDDDGDDKCFIHIK